jgi:hypothetical protein
MTFVEDLIPWFRSRLFEEGQALETWLANLPKDSGAADWVRLAMRDIAAKLRILEEFSWEAQEVRAIQRLAEVYDQYAGYRDEWRP